MAASPFSEPQNPNVSAEQPWVDSKLLITDIDRYRGKEVSLYDSDIEFKSSDGFVFQLHRSVLGVATGGFPGTESDMPTNGEVITLTEPAKVLSILFAFMYPKPSPDLHGIDFDLLLALAEAAGKYEVINAVNCCNERLPKYLPKHAAAILHHGIKHDYRRLLSEALPHFTPNPLFQTLERLQPQYMVPYARYHDAWHSIFNDLAQVVLTHREAESYGPRCEFSSQVICPGCRGTVVASLSYLATLSGPASLRQALLEPNNDPKFQKLLYCCSTSADRGRKPICPFLKNTLSSVKEKVDKLPAFATLLGLKL